MFQNKTYPLLEDIRNSTQGRNQILDFARGLAIILMVYGHMEINGYLRVIIYSFHMPLFFVVSGYFVKTEKIGEMIRKKVSGLLYPYMLLNILLILCLCLISHNPIDMVNIVKQRTLAMILGISFTNHIFTNVESVSVIWFMVCLFFSLVIFNIILNIAKDKMYIRFSLSAVVCILGWLIGTRIAFLPWSFDVALVSIIFLEFGYELRKKWDFIFERKYKWLILGSCFVIWFFGLLNHGIELAIRAYPRFPFSIISACAAVICIFFISKYVCIIFPKLSIIIRYFGCHSMIILGIHYLENKIIKWTEVFSGWNVNLIFAIRAIFILIILFSFRYIQCCLLRKRN